MTEILKKEVERGMGWGEEKGKFFGKLQLQRKICSVPPPRHPIVRISLTPRAKLGWVDLLLAQQWSNLLEQVSLKRKSKRAVQGGVENGA